MPDRRPVAAKEGRAVIAPIAPRLATKVRRVECEFIRVCFLFLMSLNTNVAVGRRRFSATTYCQLCEGAGGEAVDEGVGLPVTVFASISSTRVPSGSEIFT